MELIEKHIGFASGRLMMKRTVLIVCTMILGIPISAFGIVIHVPGDRPVIQEALDAAIDGDIVMVADGVYSGLGNTSLRISGKSLMLVSENGPETCIIDGENCESGITVIDKDTPDDECIIHGFTFRNCIKFEGGAILAAHSNLTIECCIIEENFSLSGGGIHIGSGETFIIDCTIRGNISSEDGGGIMAFGSLTISDCRILDNSAPSGNGGGICLSSSAFTMESCELSGNTAYSKGGAIYADEAEGLVRRSSFSENSAMYGGGISAGHEFIIGGQEADGNLFSNNWASAGADLHFSTGPATATYNQFSGYHLSDYYVSAADEIDLSHCGSLLTPIEQDVFVSPDGDNENDGLTPLTPLRTIQFALSRILGTESNPVTIHLKPGEYSISSNGEKFCLPALDHVSIQGEDVHEVILDARKTDRVFLLDHDRNIRIKGLTVTGGYGPDGAAVFGTNSSVVIENCMITGNEGLSINGGGIHFVSPDSSFTMTDSELTDNSCKESGGGAYFGDFIPVITNCTISGNTSQYRGGGIYVADGAEINGCMIVNNYSETGGGLYGDYDLTNCVIAGNSAVSGSGFFTDTVTIVNCTIVNNINSGSQGGIYIGAKARIHNSIIRDNKPENIKTGYYVNFDVRFSNIPGVYPGPGNIDVDPRFTANNDYHLSATSPCIDAGTDQDAPATDYDGNQRPEGGETDIGAYEFPGWPYQPRPYVTMPQFTLYPGDRSYCNVCVWNPEPHELTGFCLYVILEIQGQILFAPSFSSYPGYVTDRISPGVSCFEILPEFTWPAGAGSASGVHWYAAILSSDFSTMTGYLDTYEFGWSQ